MLQHRSLLGIAKCILRTSLRLCFFSYGILYKKWFPLALAIAAFFLRIYDYSRTNGFVATRGSSGY